VNEAELDKAVAQAEMDRLRGENERLHKRVVQLEASLAKQREALRGYYRDLDRDLALEIAHKITSDKP